MDNLYRIVKIVDEETLIINAGLDQGISIGDKFEIYSVGEKIFDPRTGEDLGTLDTIKDTVEAITVLQKMSICQHKLTYNIATPVGLNLNKTSNKTLDVDITQISGGLSNDAKIRIGDKVRKI